MGTWAWESPRGGGRGANGKAVGLAVAAAGLSSPRCQDPRPARRVPRLPQSCGHLVTCSSQPPRPQLMAQGATVVPLPRGPGPSLRPEPRAATLVPAWVIVRPVGGRRCWPCCPRRPRGNGQGEARLQKGLLALVIPFLPPALERLPPAPARPAHLARGRGGPPAWGPGPGGNRSAPAHSGFERRWAMGTPALGAASRPGLGPRLTPVPASPLLLQGTATSVPGPPLACSPWPMATA